MTKKILFITTAGCGGSEKNILNFSKIFFEEKYNVKNIIITINHKNEISNFIPTEIPSLLVNHKKLKYSFIRLYKIIKYEKPDYVFSSISLLNIYLIIVSFFLRNVKVIIRQGFMPKSKLDGNINLIRLFYRFAFKIISQTKEMKNEMVDTYFINPNKITIISNPINKLLIDRDKLQITPFNENEYYKIVSVGRITPIKDYLTCIKAIEYLIKNHNTNIHYYILGIVQDINYTNNLNKYVKMNNLSQFIHFIGFKENTSHYIYNANCFVLCSISEGLSNVFLEALYLNTPIVATNCAPFIKQSIINGLNGYCVEVGNWFDMAISIEKAIKLKYKIYNQEDTLLNNKNVNIHQIIT